MKTQKTKTKNKYTEHNNDIMNEQINKYLNKLSINGWITKLIKWYSQKEQSAENKHTQKSFLLKL